MKKIKPTNQLVILILISIFLFSCSRDSEGDNEIENSSISIQENFVGLSEAKDIAIGFSFPTKNKAINAKGTISSTKTVENIHEMKNKNGKTSFYVINYKEGGFVLLSADNRTQPILAFSKDNKFVVDESQYPPGLKFWVDDAKKQIADIQNSNIVQSEKEKHLWEHVQIQNTLANKRDDPVPPCYDHTEQHVKGPLLNSKWYQTGGFNDDLPYITCNGVQFQVYAGCVPIAMGQVMRYHQYPTSYNWSAMPTTYATSTTSSFIEDIHYAIDNVYNGEPFYDCDGTGVSASANMGNVLKTQFNYTSANSANYNSSTVIGNIESNRPVLLSGFNNENIGHMWVCDGYLRIQYYFDDCTGAVNQYFHMNWGWLNGLYNDWYSFNNFNPGNTNYNNNRSMVYNIIP